MIVASAVVLVSIIVLEWLLAEKYIKWACRGCHRGPGMACAYCIGHSSKEERREHDDKARGKG